MDAFSVAVGFLVGAATGAAGTYFGNKYTDERREKKAKSDKIKLFESLWDSQNKLLIEMKQDMDNPDFKFHREFYVLDSNWSFNHDGPYLSYRLDIHDSLKQQLKILEAQGFINDVSEFGKSVSKYRFEERFVELLRTKRI